MVYAYLPHSEKLTLTNFQEHIGKGISASHQGMNITVGAASFVGASEEKDLLETAIHISINEQYAGKFVVKNAYRTHIKEVFTALEKHCELAVVSGDNEGEKKYLSTLLPEKTTFLFHQKPADKLAYVAELQKSGKKVLMIGDGLNDAGALAQSNVGIAISENINVFSPACDAILDATKFKQINTYLQVAKKAIQIIKYCFILSLCYNVIGLYFAVTGQLTPVIAAILMPLSSISIVLFTTIATNILGTKIK